MCGLYCGTCPSYENGCDGCLSDHVAPGCDTCGNGFRDCATRHNITRCYECEEFPCKRLVAFSKKHVVHGICHHEHVLDDLTYMREHGVEGLLAALLRIEIKEILDFDLFSDHQEFHSLYHLTDERTGHLYTGKIALDVVNLKQINRATKEDIASGLKNWASLFQATMRKVPLMQNLALGGKFGRK